MRRKLALVALGFLMVLNVAQSAGAVSNAGVLFLRIAAGARAAGMGESFVALADDATATHWNPAGLGQYPLNNEWIEIARPHGGHITKGVVLENLALGEGRPTYDLWVSVDGRLQRFANDEWETDIPLPNEATTVRAFHATGRDLWLACDNGLFRNSLTGWTPIIPPSDEGWSVVSINDIWTSPGPRVWLATDDGVLVYEAAKLSWTHYGAAAGLPSPKVNKVFFQNSRQGWAVTAAGLAHFDGESFNEAEEVSVLIGETIPKLAARFIGTADQVRITRASEEIRSYNKLDTDELTAGSTLRIPYRLAFEARITCFATDVSGRLWVGTKQGLKVYHKKRWKSYGYVAYTPEQASTVTEIAREYLAGRGTPRRIEAFARWTGRYNHLEPTDTVAAGRTIYLFKNPTGAVIRSLLTDGHRLYVGTKYAFLVYEDGRWSRLYDAGLDRVDGVSIAQGGRDLWFFGSDRVVTSARARSEAMFMYVKWLPTLADDMHYAFMSYTTHMEGWGTIGANVTLLSYGEVAVTHEFGPQQVGSIYPFEIAFGLSYGNRITPNLAAGLTTKIIYSRLSDQGVAFEKGKGTAFAFAMDAGLLYRTPLSRLTLGAALTNFGPDIIYVDAGVQADALPRNLSLGFAYRLIDSPYNRLVFNAEINKELVDLGEKTSVEFKQIIYNAGFEYWYANLVALRGGWIYDEDGDIKTPTVGGGIDLQRLQIDFAYVIPVRDEQVMANILRVSGSFRF